MSADFWGVVVPAWLGALGTIAASVVALFAYITGRAAQGGVKQLADGLNRTTSQAGNSEAPSLLDGDARGKEPWVIEDDGSKVTFRNTSGSHVLVTGVHGFGVPLSSAFSFPIDVPASAAFKVIVHRILGGPAVIGVTIDWRPEDGQEISRTYYL